MVVELVINQIFIGNTKDGNLGQQRMGYQWIKASFRGMGQICSNVRTEGTTKVYSC
jgi:hypothetical protein